MRSGTRAAASTIPRVGQTSRRLQAGVAGTTAYQRLRDLLRVRAAGAGRLDDAVAVLRRRGVVAVPDLFDAGWCRDAIAELAGLYEHCETTTDDVGSDIRLWGAQRVSGCAAAFAAQPDLLAAGRRYLRSGMEVMTTMAGWLRPVEGNPGSGGGWHRDNAFVPQFKAIVYLTDVGPENGPFQYVPGSHRLRSVIGLLDVSGRRTITRYEESDFDDIAETMTGRAGTVVLTDTRGMHRGAPIATGERWALTNYCFPPHRRAEFERDFAGVAGVFA